VLKEISARCVIYLDDEGTFIEIYRVIDDLMSVLKELTPDVIPARNVTEA
jgi:hypothetical protein